MGRTARAVRRPPALARLHEPAPPWPQVDVLAYIEHGRQRVRDTFAGLTDERAATPLPATHRRAGTPFARILTGLVAHTNEHAAQIMQHVNAVA
jgi:hypothetical protein